MAGRAKQPAGDPEASRPSMPKGYAIVPASKGAGLLQWSALRRRIERARNYWIATTRPDGRPHVMPVWGVWLDGAFVFGTDRKSRKAQNLASNSAVVVHLDSGDRVGIVEGRAEEVRARSKTQIAAIDAAYRAKYKMRLTDAPGKLVIYRVVPRVAFAWREKDFNRCATRWRFEATRPDQEIYLKRKYDDQRRAHRTPDL